jgi:thiamine biosynthesis protein ThiS
VSGETVALSVTVNGEPRRVPGPATLLDLLAHLGLDARTVVVERNREIVRRARLGETPVAEGDAIELVHFVGGG